MGSPAVTSLLKLGHCLIFDRLNRVAFLLSFTLAFLQHALAQSVFKIRYGGSEKTIVSEFLLDRARNLRHKLSNALRVV